MSINSELSRIFREMSAFLDMKKVAFKPRAYERAAASIESLDQSIEDIYKKGGLKAITKIPGIGESIAKKIEAHIKTGHIKQYEALKKEIPVHLEELESIEGIGPRTILKLYKKLGITQKDELERAIKEGKLRHIKGWGRKTEEKILKQIAFLRQEHGRYQIWQILPVVETMIERLKRFEGVETIEYAGSLRRMQETIGDVDLLAVSSKPEKIMDRFIHLPEVIGVMAKGGTKSTVRLNLGIDADLRVVPKESFGAALQYFTGNKYHNIELRRAAIAKGCKLNEYGLFKGKKLIAGETEEDIYKALGFDWMPPEMRINSGELEIAAKHQVPNLVGYDDLKGDLQVHSDWTDGGNSIYDMAKAAKESGLEYICITDHTKSLRMTGGLNEQEMIKQMAEIDEVQKKFSDFKILKGAEVNILPDGSLDTDDETLAKLDVVGAAVHSHFNLSEKEMTERIIRAMENPNIDIIFHPTGRVIQHREGYKVDIDALIKAAKRTKTILEVDGWPQRLDLRDEHIRKTIDAGVPIAIDTDSHATSHFQFRKYGIGQARRGWAEAKDVINTRSWREMLKLLK